MAEVDAAVSGEGAADVGGAARGRERGLWRSVPRAAEDAPDRQAELLSEIVSLIEAAPQTPPGMERHRDDSISVGE